MRYRGIERTRGLGCLDGGCGCWLKKKRKRKRKKKKRRKN